MKKLLVTGSSGMLGGNLVHEVNGKFDLYGIDKEVSNPDIDKQFRVDLTNEPDLRARINFIKPELVVHCAAMTNVDICEEDYVLARQTNALAVKNLINAIGPKTRFVYISTDSVFDGSRGAYKETDIPSPLNNYAKTKLEGEHLTERLSRNYVVIRTNIFDWNRVRGESFAEWVLKNLSQFKPIKMFNDVFFSPITTVSLSFFIQKLLEDDFVGRLNIATDGVISKYEFGIKLAGIFGFDSSLISSISVDLFPFKAKRPKNTSLDVTMANSLFGKMPDLNEEMLRFYERRIKYL